MTTLDELFDKVNDLYDSMEEISFIHNSNIFRNELDIFVNDAYRSLIAQICNINEEDVTYSMIDIARNYIVYDDVNGYKKGRHLNNEELRREVNLIRGNVSKEVAPVNDKIGNLYSIVSDNISHLRSLGIPEEDVLNYMNELTKDIYKNTISEITGINPMAIPDNFVYNISTCVKYDDNGELVIERYTDSEIVEEAKKQGLYDKKVYIFPGEYNHALAGKIEKLDYACRNHYEDIQKLGVKGEDVKSFMDNLTHDLYKETIGEVLEIPTDEVNEELIRLVREGKTSLDGSKKSYLDNEIKLLYEFNKSKNRQI